MSDRNENLESIAAVLSSDNRTLRQLAKSAAALKPFQNAWQEVLPEPANSFIHPVYFKSPTLTIWVASPVWSNWVRHRQKQILERIRSLDLPTVSSLQVRMHPQPRSRQALDKPPITARNIEVISKGARSIEDPELRAAMLRLARGIEEIKSDTAKSDRDKVE